MQRQWVGPVGPVAVLVFAASVAVAYEHAGGAAWGWSAGIACIALGMVLLMRLSTRVWVCDEQPNHVHVGAACIPVSLCGVPTIVTRHQLSTMRRDQDAGRGFWAAPAWSRAAVAFTVDDPIDPHAFWVVGCRDAEAFAAAMRHQQPPTA